MDKPNPYKGIPRSEWGKRKDELAKIQNEELAAKKAKEAEMAALIAATPVLKTGPPDLRPKPAPTSAPRNLFSGDIKKLEVFGLNGDNVDPIPGYRLYWFLDREGSGMRMHQAKMSGWEYVLNEEVSVNDTSAISGNTDLGSQVKVFGGSFNNKPIYHYLMKKPVWLDQEHQREAQSRLDRVEGMLRRGKLDSKPEDRQYTAAEMPGSALPEISITHSHSRS